MDPWLSAADLAALRAERTNLEGSAAPPLFSLGVRHPVTTAEEMVPVPITPMVGEVVSSIFLLVVDYPSERV